MKLEEYDTRGVAYDLFFPYLSNPYRSVKLEKTLFCEGPFVCGFPQGLMLGLLLFIS